MVTEKMMHKARLAAVVRYGEIDTDAIPLSVLNEIVDAALAALSTDAEPVAFKTPHFEKNINGKLVPIIVPIESASKPKLDWNWTPLYDRPQQPAPSVAVKALADAYQKYLDAVNIYNERHAVMKTKALGTMRVDEEYKAIDVARRAFDKLAVDVATSALSAQVQDVAGWQDISTAPKNTKVLAGYKNECGNWRTVTACYHTQLEWSDEYGDHEEEYAPEAWYEESDSGEVIYPTRRAPTHWMPLPAAPAAKLEEKP